MAIEDNAKVLHIELSQSEPPGRSSIWHDHRESQVKSVPHSVKPEKLMRLLSDRNLRLLRMIKTDEPKTLAELSRLSGRPKASLTRTLARLSSLGIVVLIKAKGRGKVPTLACDTLLLEVPLVPPSGGEKAS